MQGVKDEMQLIKRRLQTEISFKVLLDSMFVTNELFMSYFSSFISETAKKTIYIMFRLF